MAKCVSFRFGVFRVYFCFSDKILDNWSDLAVAVSDCGCPPKTVSGSPQWVSPRDIAELSRFLSRHTEVRPSGLDGIGGAVFLTHNMGFILEIKSIAHDGIRMRIGLNLGEVSADRVVVWFEGVGSECEIRRFCAALKVLLTGEQQIRFAWDDG